jgi:general secretion pathway protein A
MYLDFYGFTKNPFQMTPDNEFLYMSQQHAKALVYMDYATLRPGGFVVITGEVGSGKTTLVKRLLQNITGKVDYIHLAFSNLSGNDFFHYLLRQVDIVTKKEDKISLIYTLQEYLIKNSKNGMPHVLMIDEAQNLTKDQLEDICMLAALEGSDGPLLRITLLGQPEFLRMINLSEQFKQRVKLHFHLKGLLKEDVAKYIEYRLIKSGLKSNTLFNEQLIEKIFEFSKGVPRLINKICDALLMCGYAEEHDKPRIEDIEVILPDLMIDGPSLNILGDIDKSVNHQNINEIQSTNALMERLVNAMESISDNLALIAKKD